MKSLSVSFKINTLFVLGFIFLVTACSQNQNHSNSEATVDMDMDGISEIPEWLMVQVDRALPKDGLNIWIPGGDFQASSLIRVPRFPSGEARPDTLTTNSLTLSGVRNEQVSVQIAVAADTNITNLKTVVSNFETNNITTIDSENIRVRYVKFVPVHRSLTGVRIKNINTEGISGSGAPDIVGDPLIDLDSVDIPKFRTQPIWLTFTIPSSANTGSYEGTIEIQSDQFESQTFTLNLTVEQPELPAPENYVFNTDMWFNPFAIADYHQTEYWSEEHWNQLEPYLEDLAHFGQKKILTTVVEKPWKVSWLNDEYRGQTETEFESMVKWTLSSDGIWNFDYSAFDQFVEMSLEHNNGPTIVAYSMLVFRGDQRITYFDEENDQQIEEYVDMMSDKYEEVWTVFLKDFAQHLKEKSWFDQIHLGFDERPARLMNRAFSIIENAVPEFMDKIYISGGTINLDVADLNIEITKFDEEGVQEGINKRSEMGLPTRFYQTCCSGAHPNRFTFSPSTELQMIPWLALKHNFDGYADWAYNSWPKDIYNYPVFNFTQGDEYYVYPGEDGPISSIRWELIKEGIEDFELAKIQQKNGVISPEQVEKASELATRNAYNGEKDPNDLVKARQILIQAQN